MGASSYTSNLSLIEPETHDLPGVVAPGDREQALKDYPTQD